LVRMDRKSEHAAFGPQPRSHLPPAFAAVGADPGARTDSADTNREFIGHGCFLPKYRLPRFRFPPRVRNVDHHAVGAGPFHLEIAMAAGRHLHIEPRLLLEPLA